MTPRVGEAQPPGSEIESKVVSPKSVALPNVAMVIKSIVF